LSIKCKQSRVAHCLSVVMLSVVGLLASPALHAAGSGDGEPASSRLIDAQDGWLDVSGFLDSVYGFVPVIVPITEPAVGYGAAGALVFIDRKPPDSQGRYQRPNITAVGGLCTENGTHGLFAGPAAVTAEAGPVNWRTGVTLQYRTATMRAPQSDQPCRRHALPR